MGIHKNWYADNIRKIGNIYTNVKQGGKRSWGLQFAIRNRRDQDQDQDQEEPHAFTCTCTRGTTISPLYLSSTYVYYIEFTVAWMCVSVGVYLVRRSILLLDDMIFALEFHKFMLSESESEKSVLSSHHHHITTIQLYYISQKSELSCYTLLVQ
jgi:hypothetical protein